MPTLQNLPRLKQAVLSLTLNGPSDFPLWIEPLNGNSSDKESFHETLKNNDYLWLTRVPETIREARKWVEKPHEEIAWEVHGEGYKSASFASDYSIPSSPS